MHSEFQVTISHSRYLLYAHIMMKSIKNNPSLSFPFFVGKYAVLLFFIVFSVKGIAQLHVSENTVITIKENTVVYGTDKISVAKILTAEKETKSKKSGKIAKHNSDAKKPLQSPMISKDAKPEKRKSILTFSSIPKTPSALFYSGKTTKAALVQNISLRAKFFPLKNSHNSIFHSFLLDGDQQINISLNEFLLIQQANLEEYITRPPPFQV